MQIAVLGIDLGKNSCSIVGLDDGGAVVLRRRMRREGVIELAGKLRPCVVAMEACCGAHHLGRVLRTLGHEVRLMSPEYVRPYVKSQKNDDRDAEAIAEAATRPTMRFTLAGLVGGISRPMAQQSTWFIRFTTIAANLSAPEIKPLGMMPLFFLGACRSCLGGQRGERVASIRLGRPRQMITQFA